MKTVYLFKTAEMDTGSPGGSSPAVTSTSTVMQHPAHQARKTPDTLSMGSSPPAPAVVAPPTIPAPTVNMPKHAADEKQQREPPTRALQIIGEEFPGFAMTTFGLGAASDLRHSVPELARQWRHYQAVKRVANQLPGEMRDSLLQEQRKQFLHPVLRAGGGLLGIGAVATFGPKLFQNIARHVRSAQATAPTTVEKQPDTPPTE